MELVSCRFGRSFEGNGSIKKMEGKSPDPFKIESLLFTFQHTMLKFSLEKMGNHGLCSDTNSLFVDPLSNLGAISKFFVLKKVYRTMLTPGIEPGHSGLGTIFPTFRAI